LRRIILIGVVAILAVVGALPAVAMVTGNDPSNGPHAKSVLPSFGFAAQVEYGPTSKEQCKKGGWKNFPSLGLKNQGDCVSYIATGGKNPPSGANK
jgi:hypothetical protein